MVKVVTYVVNRPGFIEIQYHLMKKHFKFDYEFIVFNDAKSFPDITNGNDIQMKSKIEDICAKYDIKCINIPNEHHKKCGTPSIRTADSVNYILEYQRKYPDKYLVLDSDMFPIADFDINRYENVASAIVLQERNNIGAKYFWNGLYYFDMTKMKDIELLDWSLCSGCDTGGLTQNWLYKNTNYHVPPCDVIRKSKEQFVSNDIYFIRHLWSLSWDESELPAPLCNDSLLYFLKNDERNKNNKFYCELYDNTFLHYRSGSSWDDINNNFNFDKHTKLYNDLKNALQIH